MRISLLALALAAAPALSAQQIAPAAARYPSRDTAATTGLGTKITYKAGTVAARTLLAGAGSLAGFVAGAFIGDASAGSHHELDALGPTIVGAAIGTAVGASILASGPRFGSTCSRAARFGLSLLGSVGGGAIGGAVGSHSIRGGGVPGYITGTMVGAALASSVCG